MKILYILVSSESDFYYEQALISMMSAKYQMPSCTISLLTERETDNKLKGARSLINEYISEKIVIDLDSSLSPMQKSRWLKTSTRKLVKGDFLYVDVDTVFAAPIDESLLSEDVMGVPDGNYPLSDHPLKWFILDNLNKLGYSTNSKYHINSGILYLKDTPNVHHFIDEWHKLWQDSCKKGIFIDQPALQQAISNSNKILKLLPNSWNAQFGRNINTLLDGIILHYYSSWNDNISYIPAYKFLQKEWLNLFRKNPKAEEFQTLIRNPKKAFDPNTFIMGNDFDRWRNSRLIYTLMNIHSSKNSADERLFKLFEKIFFITCKIYYTTIKLLYPIKRCFSKKN